MRPNLTLYACAEDGRRRPEQKAAFQGPLPSRMRTFALLLILANGVGPCAAAELEQSLRSRPSPRSLSATVGIYHWGGRQAKGFASGIRDLVDLHASIARLTISARMDIDYNRGASCIADFSLPSALDDPDLASALADPSVKVIILTVYDGTGFADCATHSYLSPKFYSAANSARMVNEYSEFVYRLHVLFENTGKTFILANWEGDNALYCGAAYSYIHSKEFRSACQSIYPLAYDGNRGPHDSVEGMILWLKTRYLGVTAGRERARLEGRTGVEVLVAAEISSVRMLRDEGLESVVYDVMPGVPFDYVSYSCYESLSHSDPESALADDLDSIRRITGSDRVILGELGFSRAGLGDRLVPATRAVTDVAIHWGVDYIIQWSLYDIDEAHDFGVFDSEGKLTGLGEYYQEAFSHDKSEGWTHPTTPTSWR